MKLIKRICPLFTKGIDDKIKVKTFKGYMSPNEILTLRGLYDSYHEQPLVPQDVDITTLTEEDIAKYSSILSEFKKQVNRKDIQNQRLARMSLVNDSVNSAAITLDLHYRGVTKSRRINMIAEVFHQCIEDFKRKNGLTTMGNAEVIEKFFGTPLDFMYPSITQSKNNAYSTVFGALYSKYSAIKNLIANTPDLSPEQKEKYEKVLKEFELILNNKKLFISLCIMASNQIKDNDNVKISTDLSYVFSGDGSDEAYQEIESVISEETKKDGWMEHTDEISSYKNMSKAIKGVLKFIPKYKVDENGNPIKVNDKVVTLVDDMMMPIYEEPLLLHREILDMAEEIDSEESLLTALKNKGTINPAFLHLYVRLKNNPALLSAFRQEYLKTYLEYRSISTKKGLMTSFSLTGNFVSKKQVMTNWLNNLGKNRNILTTSIFEIVSVSVPKNVLPGEVDEKEKYDISSTYEYVAFNKEKTKEFLNFVNEWFVPDESDIFKKTKFRDAKLVTKRDIVLKTLEYLNIPASPKDVERLLAPGKFSKIATILAKVYTEGHITSEAYDSDAVSYINTGIGSDNSMFLKDSISNILNIIDSTKPRQRERKVNWQGKTLFNHLLPSLLSNIIDTVKRYVGDNGKLKEYLDNTFLISSQFRGLGYDGKPTIFNRLLSDLYQDSTMQPVVDSLLEALKISRTLGTSDTDFSDFSSAEHLEILLSDFFSSYKKSGVQYVTEEEYNDLKSKGALKSRVKYCITGKPYCYIGKVKKPVPRGHYGNFSTFILGDANQLKSVRMPIYSYEECVRGLCDLALSEINYYKQKVAANKILEEESIQDKIKNNKVFGYLSFLNGVPELSKIGEIPITTDIKETIKKEIEKFLVKEVSDLHQHLSGINTENLLSVLSNSYKGITIDTIDDALKDFVANYALSMGCVQQISTISASMFDGSKDFAKRNKGIHSNGRQLNTEAYNPFTKQKFVEGKDDIEKCLILKEVALSAEELDSDFYDYVEKLLGVEGAKNYKKKIKTTDGQGYRIIDSYYKIKTMAGEGVDTKLDEWYSKYKELQKRCREDNRTTFNKEEILELEAIGYTPQPLKILTQAVNQFGLNDDDTLLIPQQHKYAEIILIPEMLPKDSRLKAIAEAMQGENESELAKGNTELDLVLFDTCVKVGSYAAVDIYKGTEGQQTFEEVKDSITTMASKRKHLVHLKYAKMQTNTPEHIHDSRGFGTQLRKLVLQGVKKAANYSRYLTGIKGDTIKLSANKTRTISKFNGKDLIALYNGLISANYIEGFNKFKSTIKNKKQLSKILAQQTNLGVNGNLNDVLAYSIEDDHFFAPLFDNIREHDTSANILSLYKKLVNKQTTLGGAAVQASAFGITEKQEDESLKYIFENGEIVGAECEIAWDVRVTDARGNEIELKFEDWCEENGELKRDAEGNILLDKYYPNARKLIAYRIPTEDFYSVMRLEVVRFTRKTATGGVIKVPAQGVAQAGFDFKYIGVTKLC